MGRWQIGFEYPWYLLLLLLVPFIWYLGMKSLAGLGPWRRLFAIGFRSLVVLLVIAALAGVRWIRINDNVTVIYVLDQSDSIPIAKRQLMLQFAIDNVKQHRRKEDRVGLIFFGREASIEFPPVDENLPMIRASESYLGKTDATNLESALKLAQASFPEDTARRVVVLTDGNETLGTATSVAKSMTESGIGIDVVPVRLDSSSEVLVEKIDVPSQVRQGQTVDTKVIVHKYSENGENTPIDGTLQITQRINNRPETTTIDVTLDREINVFPFKSLIQESAAYAFEAEFIPAHKADDSIKQNNRATAFTYARGKGRVMMIEDPSNVGNYDLLVQSLKRADLEVDVRTSNELFTDIVQLQAYDCVILAGLPRTSGDPSNEIQAVSDEQIEMLVRSTQQFGTGILMLGGPESFGAGGWANTKLEEAMPVDFQIRNPKLDAVGALAMVMHASELANGNHWQKVIAKSALDVLGPMDYCGVVEFDQLGDKWMWGGKTGMLKVGEGNNRSIMRSKISSMNPGDMPAFDPALQMALNSLINTPASTKHMIVISDGDPSATSQGVLDGFAAAKIKISTVAVGTHGVAGSAELQRVANVTGGNYYEVTNENYLPKIFVREARRVARPLIHEPDGGVVPQKMMRHETLLGIGEKLPRLRGFVLTQVKESPLVEVPILSPNPQDRENATILATWTYGLGRTAVFTSDGGKRWAEAWTNWDQYDQFFSQLVRWTMRPTDETGKYQISTHLKDGKVQLVVTALDQEDQFVNFLNMNARGVSPDLQPFDIKMRQVAPGRYVGEFDASGAGNYMLSVLPGQGKGILTTGATVPFSDEYRVRQANLTMLGEIAAFKTTGGSAGNITAPLESGSLKELLSMNTYRSGLPPSRSLKDIWPWAVLLGASLFFADVFVRRVAVDFGIPVRWVASKLSRKSKVEDVQRMARLDRLRGQKSAVSDELDRQRSNVQFEPQEGFNAGLSNSAAADTFQNSASSTSKPKTDVSQPAMQADEEKQGYTSRLLKAKRDAQRKNES